MANTNHNIQHIIAIVRVLSSPEKRMAGRYLKLFEGNYKDSSSTLVNQSTNRSHKFISFLFFQSICKQLIYSDSSIIVDNLSKQYSKNQIRNLGNRVLKKLHDFLVFELTIKRSTTESRHVVQQYIQRNISLLEFLLVRRIFQHFDELSDKLISLAVKNELYNEICIIYRLKLSYLVNKISIKEFNKRVTHLENFQYLADEVNKINLFVYSIQIRTIRKVSDLELKNYIENKLTYFKKVDKTIESDTWKLAYFTILLEYSHQIENYDESNKICYSQILIFNRSKFLSTKARLGSTYLQISNNYLLQQKYEESINANDQAIRYYRHGFLNYVNACEVKFFALFYLNEFDKAQELISHILQFKSVKENLLYYSRWEFFHTAILYATGDIKKAYLNYNKSTFLYEDKEGWGVGLRIFYIMIEIERGMYDKIDYELDALRKQIHKMKNSISPRFILIARFLSNFSKYDFDFNSFDISTNVIFNKLRQKSNYKWQIKTPEIIEFTNWILKIRNT